MNLLVRVSIRAIVVSTVIVLSGCGVYDSDLKTAQAYCMDKTGSSLLGTVYDSIGLSRTFICYKGDKELTSYSEARNYLLNKELDSKGGNQSE